MSYEQKETITTFTGGEEPALPKEPTEVKPSLYGVTPQGAQSGPLALLGHSGINDPHAVSSLTADRQFTDS